MSIKEKIKDLFHDVKEEGKVIKGEKSKDKKYSSLKTFPDEKTAKDEFIKSKEKLFHVNAWSDIPGVGNAAFILYSADGEPLSRLHPQKGDFIKIDLPGPLPFFWVKVTEITVEEDSAQFIVQPSHDPTDRDNKTKTDHFFKDESRSIFRVERIGNEVMAMEIGLNEAINNEGYEAANKGFINTVVSEGGWAVFQENQWKNLTDYLVGNK